MNTMYIASSLRFSKEISRLIVDLRQRFIVETTVLTPNLSEQTALEDAFEKIRKADVVYVYAKDGYVGKTVCLELGYAHALGKTIISSEQIEDESIRSVISQVLSPQELLYKSLLVS